MSPVAVESGAAPTVTGPKCLPVMTTSWPPTVAARKAPGPSMSWISGGWYDTEAKVPSARRREDVSRMGSVVWPPTTTVKRCSLPTPGAVWHVISACATVTEQPTM